MRKIIVTEFLSLDGVMEDPRWTFPYWGEDIAAFKAEETSNEEQLLLGRKTYDGFAKAWPERTDEESGGRYFNATRKYVVSTTLSNPEWNNSQVIGGDIYQSIRDLKRKGGPDIVVHGSATLVRSLLKQDLVDRLRLLVYPLVLGSGMRLFDEMTPFRFDLLDSRTFESGVVAMIYEPTRSETPESSTGQ